MNAPVVNVHSAPGATRRARKDDVMTTRFGAKRMATLAMALGLAAGTAAPARAADFCIRHYRSGYGEFFSMVGKSFKVPSKGRCKPFLGFAASAQVADVFSVTGSACTATDGSQIDFLLTEMERAASSVSFVHIVLPLPLGPSGTIVHRYANGSSSTGTSSPESCATPVMPVP